MKSIAGRGIACLRSTIEQLDAAGECLTGLAEFLGAAKPAEIRLLGEMLGEWQNWGGSLRAGNFFAGVARAVLDQDTAVQLKAWPKDRRRTGRQASEPERKSA